MAMAAFLQGISDMGAGGVSVLRGSVAVCPVRPCFGRMIHVAHKCTHLHYIGVPEARDNGPSKAKGLSMIANIADRRPGWPRVLSWDRDLLKSVPGVICGNRNLKYWIRLEFLGVLLCA